MRYHVTVGGREIEVEVDGERVVVNGTEHQVQLTPVPDTPLRVLMLDGRSYTLPVQAAGRDRWTVGLAGEPWEAEVLDERTRYIRSLTGGGAQKAGAAALKAPMPGLVVRVLVEPDQAVAAGAGVVVLEAMKMENELKAQGPGTVKAVLVRPGQAVEKGATLVEFEPA
ncbi:MAG TPA: biotin/lipoyl-containing protein [Gemmatimonadales bacterium]|nr:biotin/lipoyl-containing protein [Gemmatimonadales bacterium]